MNVDASPPSSGARPLGRVARGKPTRRPASRRSRPTARTTSCQHASSTEPATWSSFELAVQVAAQADGVGFVLAADPYCGVDLDLELSEGERQRSRSSSPPTQSIPLRREHVIVRASSTGTAATRRASACSTTRATSSLPASTSPVRPGRSMSGRPSSRRCSRITCRRRPVPPVGIRDAAAGRPRRPGAPRAGVRGSQRRQVPPSVGGRLRRAIRRSRRQTSRSCHTSRSGRSRRRPNGGDVPLERPLPRGRPAAPKGIGYLARTIESGHRGDVRGLSPRAAPTGSAVGIGFGIGWGSRSSARSWGSREPNRFHRFPL